MEVEMSGAAMAVLVYLLAKIGFVTTAVLF